MYSGLVSFTAIMIFGLIGIAASLLPGPNERAKPEPVIKEIHFRIPGNLDDRQLADYIQKELDLPMTGPAPDWSLGRNQDNNLRFRLPTPGHFHSVIVKEAEDRLQITTQPFDSWQYLFHLHEMTPRARQSDLRVRLWAYYGAFNVWALIVMSLSGLYLWLSTKRRRLWWSKVAFLTGAISFVALYIALR
jgi:hypothetical protein